MKTSEYNPSKLEVRLAEIICEIKDTINEKLDTCKIYRAEHDTSIDNPIVTLYLSDNDHDKHEIVLKIIQKPDDNIR